MLKFEMLFEGQPMLVNHCRHRLQWCPRLSH